ncbi:MAG: 4-oxalocrotonate tautomerase [Ruminococcaceae bacterium]|nr:4-oxalocrotonate tautomerase [Oscillospiraceae bacterium]
MPHIVVKMYKGRTEEQKSELAKALVETAVKVTGRGAEHFSVAVEDYDPEVWTNEVYDKEIVAKQDTLYVKPGYGKLAENKE